MSSEEQSDESWVEENLEELTKAVLIIPAMVAWSLLLSKIATYVVPPLDAYFDYIFLAVWALLYLTVGRRLESRITLVDDDDE